MPSKPPANVVRHRNSFTWPFPLTAVMNHECTPNAVIILVRVVCGGKAARFIPKGGENYNNVYENFMEMTKNFTCDCVRCNDNTISD
ncbi:hypothetical protein DOY81_010887 [Sarcophaga bullata]|nr:hypothetical protein DOY81_010887 [Sarcophaga bullata]